MPDIHDWKPSHNPWAVALTVTLATFMEVLDTSIANVALPHMAGSLGASQEEATWVLTSYLVASAIILPISGWLATRVWPQTLLHDLRRDLHHLLIPLRHRADAAHPDSGARLAGTWRGGLAPSEQAILADSFPVARRGQAFAVYGMAVVVAPAIGPTLGGWITDNFNWHWIFFINIPIGLLSLFLSNRMVEDPPYLKEQRAVIMRDKPKVDFTGLGLVAVGVGCLEFVLDKGQEKDWFGDSMITTFFIVAICLLVFFVFWEWRHPDPIVDLRLLKNRNFGTAVFLQFILGIVLFSPPCSFRSFCRCCSAIRRRGRAWCSRRPGFLMMVLMPVAGILVSRMDPRLLVSIGYAITAIMLYQPNDLDLNVSFGQITLWRALQVMGLPFIFIPISTLNYVGVPRDKNNQISSFSNFARNLGGSMGTAMLTTFLIRTAQTHQNTLAQNTGGTMAYQRLHRQDQGGA